MGKSEQKSITEGESKRGTSSVTNGTFSPSKYILMLKYEKNVSAWFNFAANASPEF